MLVLTTMITCANHRFWALFPSRGEGSFYKNLSQWIAKQEFGLQFTALPPFFPLAIAPENYSFSQVQILKSLFKTKPHLANKLNQSAFLDRECNYLYSECKLEDIFESADILSKIATDHDFFLPLGEPMTKGFIFALASQSETKSQSIFGIDQDAQGLALQGARVANYDLGIIEIQMVHDTNYKAFYWKQFFNSKLFQSIG